MGEINRHYTYIYPCRVFPTPKLTRGTVRTYDVGNDPA